LNNLVLLDIRKIIFENYNDVDTRFNNDQILEFLKKNEVVDSSITVDNLEGEFEKIEDDGLVRCIAQNFTTKWFKLYNDVEKIHCDSCNNDVHVGKDESRKCPNSECSANL